MKSRVVALAGAFILSTVMPAHAVEVKKKVEAPGPPDDVWKIASGFCSIKTWHPAFSGCTQYMEDGVVWRVLTLRDGGAKIKEKLTGVDDHSYNYSITEGPLPISNYAAKVWVEQGDKPDQSVVRWEVSFDVDAAESEKTTKIIDGILGSGLENIKNIAAKNEGCKQ